MTDKTTPALLKDILGPQALAIIADVGVSVSSRFDRVGFLSAASDRLDTLSIMERVRHIADALYIALPPRYMDALEIIRAMVPKLTHGFQAVAATEYVARYGLGDFDRSMIALTDLTRFGSAEFAIRPFLVQDTERTIAVMNRWTSSADEHVRRLASEGSRPRLPWAFDLAIDSKLRGCDLVRMNIGDIVSGGHAAHHQLRETIDRNHAL